MIDFKKGLKDGIPIALGYLSVSFTFGLQAVNSNLSWWEAVFISLTNLTSAGQFAGLDIMIRGGGFWFEMACTQFIINIRYALMSLSLSQKVDKSVKGIHRFLTGFGITDEIFAVSMGNDEPVSNKYLYGVIILPILGWVSGTFLGAVAGQVLPDVVRSSLSLAIYGMFIAIIIPPAKKNKSVMKVIIISVLLSCAFKWIPVLNGVSSGFVIIICTVISATVGAILFPVTEEKE
ncbi:MAG: AzlC family ABC transporter permease [Acutalibacteraceae bacterium]|nr:AzlC family ABC transporter permease [Acutalibacteraceae bacterium]